MPARIPWSGLAALLPVATALFWWHAGMDEHVVADVILDAPARPVAKRVAVAQPGDIQAEERVSPRAGVAISAAWEDAPEKSSFARFASWTARWAESDGTVRESLLEDGIRLAETRREDLRQLIQSDPERALGFAVPVAVARKLPPQVRDLLEERISGEGDNLLVAALPPPDSEADGRPIMERVVRVNGRDFTAFAYGRRVYQPSKRGVPMHGIAVDGALALHESPLRVAEPGELADDAKSDLEVLPHAIHPSPAARPPVVQIGSRFTRLCCGQHVAELEQGLIESERGIGPAVAGDVGGGGPGSNPGLAWTTGVKRMLVIRVDFSDKPGEPEIYAGSKPKITPTYAANLASQVLHPWFQDVSYGNTGIQLDTSDVTQVYRMPNTAAHYATGPGLGRFSLLESHARNAASAHHNLAGYERISIVFSHIGPEVISGSNMYWSGLGMVGAETTWFNGYFDGRTVLHELGHTFGLPHANKWKVPVASGSPVDPSGFSQEYGDNFDRMGSDLAPSSPVTGHFNPEYLTRLGWLPQQAVLTLPESSTGPQTFRIHRFDSALADLGNTMALRVPRDGFRDYWISHRRARPGLIADSAYFLWSNMNEEPTQLLDINTPGNGNTEDAGLEVGQTLNDAAAGLEFTLLARGGSAPNEWIDLRVVQSTRFAFESRLVQVIENSGNAVVRVVRRGNVNGSASVNFATANGPVNASPGVGTATAGSDYTAVSGTLNWASGEGGAKQILIPITNDAITEGVEAFRVQLSNPATGAVILPGNTAAEVRIVEPGAFDVAFSHAPFNGNVDLVLEQQDGKVLVAGYFTTIYGTVNQPRGRIARLNADGSLDTGFLNIANSGVNAAGDDYDPIRAIAQQPDGKILVGGTFNNFNGQTRNRLVRLNPDGMLDSSFSIGSGPNDRVSAIAVQADGRILVGGLFSSFNGTARRGLVRLLENGQLDTSFAPTAISSTKSGQDIQSFGFHPAEGLLVGGRLYNPSNAFRGILGLDRTGAALTGFDVGTSAFGDVTRIHCATDGLIVISGSFTEYNGTARNQVARLTSGGALDGGMQNPALENTVWSSTRLSNGKLAVIGDTPVRARLLNSGGTRDTNFVPPFGGDADYFYGSSNAADGAVFVAAFENPGGIAIPNNAVRKLYTGAGAPGRVRFREALPVAYRSQSVTIEVERVDGSAGAAMVRLVPAFSGNTAVAGTDYVYEPVVLQWADGESGVKAVEIPLLAGSGDDRQFALHLGEALGVSGGTPSRAVVSIIQPSFLESWRLVNFGNANNAGRAANAADFDDDGVLNLVEYAFGLNPLDGQSMKAAAEVLPKVRRGQFGPVFEFSLPEPVKNGVRYVLETTDDLGGEWNEAARHTHGAGWHGLAPGVAVTPGSPANGRRPVEVQVPAADRTLFGRFRLDPDP